LSHVRMGNRPFYLWCALFGMTSLVSDTTNRENDLRVLRVLLNLGAQTLHVDIDQTGVGGMSVAPHLTEEFLPGEYLLRFTRQFKQQIKLQRGEGDLLITTLDGVPGHVDGQITDLEGLGGLIIGAAQACTDAC